MTPAQILALPARELQQAILVAMAERATTRTAGMTSAEGAISEIFQHAAFNEGFLPHQQREYHQTLQRTIHRAFDDLKAARLIERAADENGRNGFMNLSPEGEVAAKTPIDLEAAHIRELLKPEMLHPKLRGKPYQDFANGEPTSAISEAFKIVEIEVRTAARMPNGHGQQLMNEAFDPAKGPLTDQGESENMRRALPKLFAGAMGRFRSPSTHEHRKFPDLCEAIEELLVASRLLRYLDEPSRK